MIPNFEYRPEFAKLPKEMCDLAIDAVHNSTPGWRMEYYAWFNCPKELEDYIRNNVFVDFPSKYRIQLQTVKNGISIHKDTDRVIAYNYLISDGFDGQHPLGPVNLFFDYDEENNLKVIETVHHIKPHIWHTLSSQVFHSVINFYGERIAVTMSPEDGTQ